MLQSIDVDRIVMEHYQATNTPRGSASHNMGTPLASKFSSSGLEENSLSPELSELCSHQCKVGQVPIEIAVFVPYFGAIFSILSH